MNFKRPSLHSLPNQYILFYLNHPSSPSIQKEVAQISQCGNILFTRVSYSLHLQPFYLLNLLSYQSGISTQFIPQLGHQSSITHHTLKEQTNMWAFSETKIRASKSSVWPLCKSRCSDPNWRRLGNKKKIEIGRDRIKISEKQGTTVC